MDNMNGINGHHGGSGHGHRPRLPTIERALQCSPFLSILPVSQDTIAFPLAQPPQLPSTPYAPSDHTQFQQLLQNLDAEASLGSQHSPHLDQVLRDIHSLADVPNMTKYAFKNPALNKQHRRRPQSQNGKSAGQAQSSKLGIFAEYFLHNSSIEHDIPEPVHQKINTLVRDTGAVAPPLTAPGQLDVPEYSNGIPSLQAEHTAPGASQGARLVPTIVIPTHPIAAQRTAHSQAAPAVSESSSEATVGTKSSPSKKRKRDNVLETSKKIEVDVDQRDRAEAAGQALQGLVFNLLEAEDQLEPDTSGTTIHHGQDFFIPGFEGSSSHILRSEVHKALEDVITKGIKLKKFQDIPVEQLLRLQKLCAMSFIAPHDLRITTPMADAEDTTELWFSNVRSAENSLRASKVILKMMIGGREEKQLQSDEVLQDLLTNTRYILDSCLAPIIQTRATAADTDFWTNRKEKIPLVTTLLNLVRLVLKLLGDLVVEVELSETAINAIEFLATSIIFIENVTAEKDSLPGIQKVEYCRRYATELLAKVFLRYPSQRNFIFDEILSSLEKLPVTRQSARQYKVLDGKPIQGVSALIMQLIQTSAIRVVVEEKHHLVDQQADDQDEEESDEDDEEAPSKVRTKSVTKVNDSSSENTESLYDIADPLYRDSWRNASYVVSYLVQRAMTSTKTGDQPYRHLLDIFTEDFISVLGSPDWPASEFLLRALLSSFVNIMDNDKSSAPAKNMALDLMTLMGSGIADVQAHVQRLLPSLENSSDSFFRSLFAIGEDTVNGRSLPEEIHDIDGPYAAVVAYYSGVKDDDLQVQSARAHFLAQWANDVLAVQNADNPDEEATDAQTAKLKMQLKSWILQPDQVKAPGALSDISQSECRLAYAIVILNLRFCRGLIRIFNIMLTSISSNQATVRSKAIKSVVQLIDKDPAILERASNVLGHIVNSASDPSPMVRDSVLALIGKCISLRPALEAEGCRTLIGRTVDSATIVRKRALRLLREVYPRTKYDEVRTAVADAILRRVADAEESVAELARQTMEELWFHAYHGKLQNDLSAHAKLQLQQHAYHIVKTTVRSADTLSVFELLTEHTLAPANKNATDNLDVATALVTALFDGIIDNDVSRGDPSQASLLQSLTVFAKSSPRLFNGDQMTLFKPYIQNLSSTEDLIVYRAVLVIYRNVLPVLPPLQQGFLQEVQDILFKSVSKLGQAELGELAACLWIIDSVLKNTERLVNLVISVLRGIHATKLAELTADPKKPLQIKRYMAIAGQFGRACNLEAFQRTFKERFPSSKSETVSGLLVDIIVPFASPDVDIAIREATLEAVGLICQSSPKNFLKASVTTSFKAAFQDKDPKLALAIVTGVKDFYLAEEERSKTRAEADPGAADKTGADRLGKSMVLSDNDGAATSMAQHFLPHVISLALSSYDDLALVCTEVMVSTDRQGLVHPKETGPPLVALETSPNEQIAQLAYAEHQALHTKHESVLDSEYIKAVERAFAYQRDTVKDVSGLDGNQQPKLRLFWEVLKTGSIGMRRKLLAKLCTRSLMDVNKIESLENTLIHLAFVRFTLENLAAFDYSRIDEVLAILTAVEKACNTTGTTIVQKIEPLLQLPADASAVETAGGAPQSAGITDQNTLRHLTACSTVLTLLWDTRTVLRKAWTLQSYKLNGKVKQQAKDTSKAPNKATNYPNLIRDYIAQVAVVMTSMNTPELMVARCSSFVELMTVDSELKLASDEDDNGEPRYKTPEMDDEDDSLQNVGTLASNGVPGSGRGRKRKGTGSVGGTPRKPRLGKRPSMIRKGSRAASSTRGSPDADAWD